MKYALSIVFALALSALGIFVLSQETHAANKSDFNPGHIIDDAVFYNSNSMNVSQIQTFLESKNPNCDYNGTQSAADWGYPSLTHAQLAEKLRNGQITISGVDGSKFHAPPYKCLTRYNQSTPQMEAASGYCSAINAGTRTAAQIIKDVANACGINPQVLVILLEKEQSLVTDKWPLNRQLQNATGFACPDTAPCDPAYGGFFYQVYHAARQFKVYQANPNSYNYRAGRNNNIYWHPDLTRCGSSTVYIQNQATAALYIYTPYRPNSAALNNLYGTGDSCSSYGNRNFWRIFTDWFGSTQELYNYNFERLVGQGGMVHNGSLAVGSGIKTLTVGSSIYTFYSDTATKGLRLATWNGSRWSDIAFDGPTASTLGSIPSAMNVTTIEGFLYQGKPQIYYYDQLSKTLRHGFIRSNGVWATEALDGTSWSILKRTADVGSSITTFAYGEKGIQLYYYNNTDKRLEHSWWDGKVWKSEILDGNAQWGMIRRGSDVGSAISGFAYGAKGIQLYYYNNSTKDLEHSWWDGKVWKNEILDGSTNWSIVPRVADVGSAVSATLYKGKIQLFYHNRGTGELVHTWWNGKKWSSESMDGETWSVLGNQINAGKAVETHTFNDHLFVAYYDDATGFSGGRTSALRIAYWSGTGWVQNTLDGGTTNRSGSSLSIPAGSITLDSYGTKSLQVFYRDNASQLKHAWIQK